MLTHPTHGRLVTLGLTGMAKALDEQQRQPDIATLAFEERLALLVDREATERENKRLISRLRFASLRQNAVVEDIDMKAPRGLDRYPVVRQGLRADHHPAGRRQRCAAADHGALFHAVRHPLGWLRLRGIAFVAPSPNAWRVCCSRSSSATLLLERRTSLANGACGRQDRHDSAGMRLLIADAGSKGGTLRAKIVNGRFRQARQFCDQFTLPSSARGRRVLLLPSMQHLRDFLF